MVRLKVRFRMIRLWETVFTWEMQQAAAYIYLIAVQARTSAPLVVRLAQVKGLETVHRVSPNVWSVLCSFPPGMLVLVAVERIWVVTHCWSRVALAFSNA